MIGNPAVSSSGLWRGCLAAVGVLWLTACGGPHPGSYWEVVPLPTNAKIFGIQFLDPGPTDIRRLRRLVDGIRDGSVSEAIRRSIREENRDVLEELRRRPMDQKVIFALSAERKEIDALIRDGVPTVVIRLLSNPRLTAVQVKQVLRDARMNTRVLIAVRRERKWMNDEENRFLFCIHPHAPLQDALNLLNQLSVERLKAIQANGALKQPLRAKAGLLITQKRGKGF